MKKYELLITLAEMELKLLVIKAKEDLELIDTNEGFEQSLEVLSDYDPLFLGREYCLSGGLYNDKLLGMVKEFDYVNSRFSEFFSAGYKASAMTKEFDSLNSEFSELFVAGYNKGATELDTDIVDANVLKA